MGGILTYLVCALLYALVAAYSWLGRGGIRPLVTEPALTESSGGWRGHLILAPLALHGYTLARSVFAADGLYLGVGGAVSAIVFLAILVYWLAHLVYGMDVLQALMAPVGAVAVVLPALFPAAHPLPNTALPVFKIHLLIAMLAYSLFTIAALHAALMHFAERSLHHPVRSAILANLPPLLSMETLLFRILWVGFGLLTLTLVTGVLFSEELFDKPVQFTHKTVFGFISWGIYAALLAGRHFQGWRGKVAVRWTLAGFVALLLAYVGSKFVLEVILAR